MGLFVSDKSGPRMKVDGPRKAWESRRFEHLRWSFPETFADVKRVFAKRQEWRMLDPGEEPELKEGPPRVSNPWESPQVPQKLVSKEGGMGTMLARAFQRRETMEVACKKYLGKGDDGGKGRPLFEAAPMVFEESGSIVPQRALRVREKKSEVEVPTLSEAEILAAAEAEGLEKERYWKERKKLRMITAQRHTSRKRKPNGGFYSSDTVAAKIWEYHTAEYAAAR